MQHPVYGPCTVNVSRISHRKWRESKQQLIRLLDLTLLGYILVSFHILCDILQTLTVYGIVEWDQPEPKQLSELNHYPWHHEEGPAVYSTNVVMSHNS